MKTALFTCTLFLLQGSVCGESTKRPPGQPSRCHAFIDHENIWTLEVLEESGESVPILNIIILSSGEWEFRTRHVHLYNSKGEEAQIRKFSMGLGGGADPYVSEYLKVRGNGAIGIDLVGQFEDFSELIRVLIDLGSNRFELESLHCTDFNSIAEKINRINFDSPNILEDFEVLRIEPLGKITVRPED